MPSKTYDADAVKQILKDISTAGQRLEQNEPGSQETLLEQAKALVFSLESPLESIYGFLLAEVTPIDAPPRGYTSLNEWLTANSLLC